MTRQAVYLIVSLVLLGGVVVALLLRPGARLDSRAPEQPVPPEEKVYVALEGEGTVAVLNPQTRQVITKVDLVDRAAAPPVQYMAHNVQVAPNGKTVWVTANAMVGEHDMGGEETHMTGAKNMPDQALVIDPLTDTVVQRISLGQDSHLAHVVVAPDSSTAYVTAQGTGELYRINAATFVLDASISLGAGSGPHGLRISTDGSRVYVALLDGRALAVVDARSDDVTTYPVPSGVVQTAVTPDDRLAFASLYTTKQILRFDVASQTLSLIDLPAGAKGPVQLAVTPDSRYVYIADQGYYFNEPTSTLVYRLDVEKSVVDQTVEAGSGPHGIVVDRQGTFAYVTNLLSNDVSIIEIATGHEVARVPVGAMPNGISIWNRSTGGI